MLLRDLNAVCGSVARKPSPQAKPGRRGGAAVEFAFVVPVLFLLVLGMIEFGRMLMVQQILTNGAREGARKAVLPGSNDGQVYQTIDNYLNGSGVQGHSRDVSPSAGSAQAGTPVRVTVSVPYESVSWMGATWLRGKSLRASVEMRKEEY